MTWIDILLLLLGITWVVWWLFGVNWWKLWPALANGAWMPVLLLAVMAALVWSQLQPSDCHGLGFMTIANGLWQFFVIAGLLAVALFCGWLQGYFAWEPEEISVEPPAPAEGHAHGHAHH